MRSITIEELHAIPVPEQRVELVERKGVGHPDSICDAIMEAISVALCREYQATFGRIVHHNIDKGLLVAGRTTPRVGGGSVDEPMRLIFGDRAIYEFEGKSVPVGEIAVETAQAWLRQNLRFVDPVAHVIYQNEIKPGSPELTDIFDRKDVGANDTSAAVGYAPYTETERAVLASEQFINGPVFKGRYPEAGEDVKVMGFRRDKDLILTVAIAYVDRFVQSPAHYFARKEEMQAAVSEFVKDQGFSFQTVRIDINTLDDPNRGEDGMYLTVLGTSAEGGDGGQVGRGNKVNRVIALNRPMSTEAAAGKNPISHVGKIYNLLSHHMALEVYKRVKGLREVYIWLCSQIGVPIDQPLIASAQVILEPGVTLVDVQEDIAEAIDAELEGIYTFTQRLSRGELPVW